jgi:Protein of unknown function (DUF3224)
MEMRKGTKVTCALLIASTFLLALAPAAIVSSASTGSSLTEIHGVWTLAYLNSTTLYTKGNWQYGAGYGPGNITGAMHGNAQGEFLTAYNTKTQVIKFSGQIVCECTLFGKSGTVWIAMIHGIDVNASNPNGKTTATFVITEASGGLKGLYGSGKMKTTTSSDNMNFTMWVGFKK